MKQIILCALLLSSACASRPESSTSGKMVSQIFDFWKELRGKVSETTSEKIRVERVKLAKPIRIGTYFAPAIEKRWDWRSDEKRIILNRLEKVNGVAEIRELYGLRSEDEVSPRELRERAAQQGLDALLIVQGEARTESDLNSKALTYVAILPTFFVNGNRVKSEFEAEAVLWDVRTSYVHTGAKGTGNWVMNRPLFFPQKERALRKSRNESLRNLAEELAPRLEGQLQKQSKN